MLYFPGMDPLTNTNQDPALSALLATYKAYKQKAQALEAEHQAVLQQAMKLLQEDRMQEARKKLESMLH